jgi:hypothetical protein
VSVSSGAALDMAGVSQTFGNVNNAGTIFTHGAGPGTTLTVANYVGAGGNIVFNTFLGADNSPSDRLLINGGTATGTTTLTIHNTTGPGEPTIANGIPVVNAINGATTAAGAFTLAPGELRAGIFDYRLFQGGITGSDPNRWFFRPSWCRRRRHLPCHLHIYQHLGRRRRTYFRRTRRPQRYRRACIRSSGRKLRPMASFNRSRGRWVCRSSARCTNVSAIH